jgi:tRNA(Ile)-lysidine synthase
MSLVDQVLFILRLAVDSTGFDLEQDQLVVGVSGGPDSLALLHALQNHIPADRLIVAHLDHGLRHSSAAEARQVFLAAKGSRFHTERVDVAALARKNGQSLEEAGRIARYELLTQVARKEGAAHIAVGHNREDQVETILMHVLRGSGLAGLCGMQPASPLPGHTGLWLLRPLLSVTREEIETYCAENHLAPILDESNTSHSFLRNRIRGELLPLLETYNPQVRQRVIEMGEILTAEEEYLTSQAAAEWNKLVIEQGLLHVILHRSGWLALPLALRRRLLRLAVAAIQPGARDTGFRAIESARAVAERGETGSRVDLPGDVAVLVSYDQLIIKNEAADLARGFPQLLSVEPLSLPIPGKIELADGWQLTAEWLNSGEFDLNEIHANRDTWQAYVALTAADSLIIRPRLPGERMRPLGLNGERKLKEIMIDRKIPAHLRERWPVVATQDHTVWIVGHVMDERVRVISRAEHVVRLRCLPPGHHETS